GGAVREGVLPLRRPARCLRAPLGGPLAPLARRSLRPGAELLQGPAHFARQPAADRRRQVPDGDVAKPASRRILKKATPLEEGARRNGPPERMMKRPFVLGCHHPTRAGRSGFRSSGGAIVWRGSWRG